MGTLALAGLIVGSACHSDRQDELLRLAPGLDPEFAFHIVNDDSTALRVFVSSVGFDRMNVACYQLASALPTSSLEEFAAGDSVLGPYLDRATWAHAAALADPAIWARHSAWRRRPIHERLEIQRLRKVAKTLGANAGLLELQGYLDACRPYADVLDTSSPQGGLAFLLLQRNRNEEGMRKLDMAIEIARRMGNVQMQCQLLGSKSAIFGAKGDVDSMFACVGQGIRVARQAESVSEARLLRMSAGYWSSLGRPLRAMDLLKGSAEIAAAHGDIRQEATTVTEIGWLHKRLSCWDLALQEAQRAESLVRPSRSDLNAPPNDDVFYQAAVLRARCIVESSDRDAGLHETGWLLRQVSRQPPGQRERAAIAIAEILGRSGRPWSALQVLRECRSRCEQDSALGQLPPVFAATATMAVAVHDYVQCAQVVSAFHSLPADLVAQPWPLTQIDVCSIEATAALQGAAAAADTLRAALRRYQARILEPHWSFELALAAPTSLLHRAACHALQDNAEAGYAFEMGWRKLLAVPSKSADLASLVPVRGMYEPAALSGSAGGLRLDQATHCVYTIVGDDIVRWTARDDRITRDVLPVSAPEVQGAVDDLLRAIESSGAAPAMSAHVAAGARRLARWLLPPSMLHGDVPARFFVTSDGFLYQVPFGLLNLVDEGYRPLVQKCDIAAIRYWRDDGAPAAPRSALLVTSPTYDAKVRRAYPLLNNVLPASELEATTFARLVSRSEMLSGPQATKSELVARWSRFDCLYFACHMVQHPRLPFLSFVPLADPSSSPTLADAYLEPADIRAADLSRCQLVVLSGCSSAVPYAAPNGVEPSLGQAFVDAGARCVISTLWDVTDTDAAALMSQFAAEYERSPTDPVGALGNAQRELLRLGASPSQWAAYTAAVAGPTPAAGSPGAWLSRSTP